MSLTRAEILAAAECAANYPPGIAEHWFRPGTYLRELAEQAE